MNYLAHLFLSGTDEGLIAGNFLADMIRNAEVAALPEDIQAGIRLHRQIDSFTDNHPAVREANKILHPYYHKYAPVVTDMYGDYFLAHNWHRFTTEKLPDFYDRVYTALMSRKSDMPEAIHKRLEHMVRNNWLSSYTHLDGLGYAFLRLSQRIRFRMDMSNAIEVLELHEDVLGEHFLDFFPDLMRALRN